jgi:hypothetical protein
VKGVNVIPIEGSKTLYIAPGVGTLQADGRSSRRIIIHRVVTLFEAPCWHYVDGDPSATPI